MAPSEFESTLRRQSALETSAPLLPLAHLTAKRCLEGILASCQLKPRFCKVFSKNLLYFSYGGAFYRTSKLQTENVSELPVALVFSPELLRSVSAFYPFDSGAMDAGKFGPDWETKLSPFKSRFAVEASDGVTEASLLVDQLYTTNESYLSGNPDPECRSKEAPFPVLHEFLSADLSGLESDHRQRTIEALSNNAVEINQHLLWIGFPHHDVKNVLTGLRKCTGLVVPQFWTYQFTRNFNPSEMAAKLEQEAYSQVIERYMKLPR